MKNGRMLKHFFFSYIMILVIPIIFGGMIYRSTITVVEEECKSSTLSLLESFKTTIDGSMLEVDRAIAMIVEDYVINNLKNMRRPEYGSSNAIKTYDALRHFGLYKPNYPLNGKFYILYKEQDIIISDNVILYDIPFFYENYLADIYGIHYSEWYDIVFNNVYQKRFLPENIINQDRQKNKTLSYIQSLPVGSSDDHDGVIIFLFNHDRIFSLLKNTLLENKGYLFMTDEDYHIIAKLYSGNEISDNIDLSAYCNENTYARANIDGKDMILTQTTSDYNGMRFIALLPTSVVMERVSYVKQLYSVNLAIILSIGLILSFLLSYSNTKPLKDILRIFRVEGVKKHNEYEIIKNNIMNLINNNDELTESLGHHSDILQSVYLDKLIKGDFDFSKDPYMLLSHAKINIENKYFVVIVLNIIKNSDAISKNLLDELDFIRLSVEKIVHSEFGDDVYIHITENNEIVLIFCFEKNIGQKWMLSIQMITNNLNTYLSGLHHANTYFGIGGLCTDATTISKSYREARQAFDYCMHMNKGLNIFWYKDFPVTENQFYYPVDLETQIINFTKSGNIKELSQKLDLIFDENYKISSLTKFYHNHLFYNMKCTLIKIMKGIHHLPSETESRIINDLENIKDRRFTVAFSSLRSIFEELCTYMHKNKKSHNTKTLSSIVEYVGRHYTDCNLSLKDIASRFNMSESYFSQYFKEQTGESYSTYVEKIRIENACRLLKEGEISIEEVSGKVGYFSSRTFRRAFKKNTGMTPVEYRQT